MRSTRINKVIFNALIIFTVHAAASDDKCNKIFNSALAAKKELQEEFISSLEMDSTFKRKNYVYLFPAGTEITLELLEFVLNKQFNGRSFDASDIFTVTLSNNHSKILLPSALLDREFNRDNGRIYSGGLAEEIIKVLPFESLINTEKNRATPLTAKQLAGPFASLMIDASARAVYLYRSADIHFTPHGNQVIFLDFTPSEAIYLLRGLRELGLRSDHPIFNLALPEDLEYRPRIPRREQ
jgi:hypothetical protein